MSEHDFAYELNGQRVTRERFYAVACDPRRSVAVEACAGAGKTWMLVSRILRALLEGAQPHEILAITFTKKAAGEMRQRLHEWLAEFADAPEQELRQALAQRGVQIEAGSDLPARLKALYAQLLASGRPVQIRTFHSWFAALLRTAPLATMEQMGLPARHELLENDKEAVALVWRRFYDAVANDAPLRLDYERSVATYGRTQTQKALASALGKRVEFALADADGVLDASVRPWDEMFADLAGGATPDELISLDGPVRSLLIEAARFLGRGPNVTATKAGSRLEMALSANDLPEAISALLTEKLTERKFSDKLAGLDTVKAAQALMLRVSAAVGQHEAWLHQGRMTRLTRLLIDQYADLKREEGWVDMNDVERAALVMLSDSDLSGWVQERLDARVSHLLVDEFQDTNPLQWQALSAWLSGYVGAGGGRAPSVFMVGDPKQSIYRFRRAEPQVFRAAQAFVVQGLGGDRLSCDHTHRNAPAVLFAMNQVMSEAQSAGAYEGFRPHTTESKLAGRVLCLPAIPRETAAADDDAPSEAGWRDSLVTPRELSEEKRVALECRQAARWLAGRLAQGLAPREVMVLARKRSRLSVMEGELRALGIPAQQPEKTELSEQPETQDLIALMDVLVSPAHDLSLARALKSPIFLAPDDALVELAERARQQQGPSRYWLDLLQQETWAAPALTAAAERMGRWKRWVDRMPPHDALDAIFHDGDVLARYAQAAPPALREGVLANLRALLGAALQVAGGRFLTPYAFVRAMRAGGVRAPAMSDANAVRLLTVHGAKGLEAPLVLMLDTDGEAARAESMGVIVDWPGEAAAPRRFAFLASESRAPACCLETLEAERQARQREELNGLYVAMTRARRELAVSSMVPRSGSPGSWWQRLLPVCEPVAPEALETAAAQLQPARETLWLPVAPALPEAARIAPAAAASASLRPTPDTDESRFGQALHRLLEHWPAAADTPPATLKRRVQREFALDAPTLDAAAAMACAIRWGEGAWSWDAAHIDWAGNEVELRHKGEALRLDRLVRERATGAWWVLDYKSAARPQQDAALIAQLRRYRDAVALANPGATVQAAFLTGQGRLAPLA